MLRLAPIIAIIGAMLLLPAAAGAQSAPHCPPGHQPQFLFGFAALKAHLGETMGQPVECEHGAPGTSDRLQQTTTGLAYYRPATNTPSFTDGYRHWAHTPDGLVYWEGESVDPPAEARPAPAEFLHLPARIVGTMNVRSWPRVAPSTLLRQLGHNTPVWVTESVYGDDGDVWYRIGEAEYVHSMGVRLPRPPAEYHSGRWIDADLTLPAMVTAYEGDTAVYAALTIPGVVSYQTPTGTFEILRRVENETMDSATVGIPRDHPDGYYLTDVLFTQYFTWGGASLHYNYWKGTFGYPGSHGCLGLNYDDALWFWNWASIGTPLVVHR